jgi:uncharacterized protein (DUF362 family)
MKDNFVVVQKSEIYDYPNSPFDPSEVFPESNELPYQSNTNPENHVYSMVRQLIHRCGFDEENYGKRNWNPLSGIIRQGNMVVIKPNCVKHNHPFGTEAVISTVANGSIIRPLIDYTILALNGHGQIVICDAPLQSADFQQVCKINGLNDLISFYKSKNSGIDFSLVDLRKKMLVINDSTKVNSLVDLPGDPLGYSIIDLGQDSYHAATQNYWERYYVTGYDVNTLRSSHNKLTHKYCISNTLLKADAVISVPKLKTHKKAGITCALKNFIGINGSKDFLPHHRVGRPCEGGDECPPDIVPKNLRRIVKSFANGINLSSSEVFKTAVNRKPIKRPSMEGNWNGNDTIWRTINDLNIIMRYSDRNGKLTNRPQRKFFFLIDGIIGQEKLGPMTGYPKKCGVLLAGVNPLAVDYVAARVMGFNYRYIKQIVFPFKNQKKTRYPLVDFKANEIEVSSNIKDYENIHDLRRKNSLNFSAAPGWVCMEGDS